MKAICIFLLMVFLGGNAQISQAFGKAKSYRPPTEKEYLKNLGLYETNPFKRWKSSSGRNDQKQKRFKSASQSPTTDQAGKPGLWQRLKEKTQRGESSDGVMGLLL